MECLNQLCRVCSGRGEFDLFLPIPIFLHAHINEHSKWKKNISELIKDITGLSIDKEDGLPQKICEICISYLKHASAFREQALNNTLSLVKALNLSVTNEQQTDCFLNKTESYENDNNSSSKEKFFKNNYNFNNNNNNVNNLNNNLKQVLNVKTNFNEYLITNSNSLDNNTTQTVICSSSSNNCRITEPEMQDSFSFVKERKCKYCKRKYMFEESFNEHLSECIERKLTIFIWELNYIHSTKENKQITSTQFIQKVINILKENLIILIKYCNDFNFPDVIPVKVDENITNQEVRKKLDNILNKINNCNKNEKLDFFTKDYDLNVIEKINYDKILYDSRKLSESSNSSTPLIPMPISPVQKIRCTNCDISFDSLSCLEIHNFKFHNDTDNTKSIISNSKLIELFEKQDGLIDVSHTFSGNYFKVKINKTETINLNNSQKMNKNDIPTTNCNSHTFKDILCARCGAKFLTITHLDQHIIKHHNNI